MLPIIRYLKAVSWVCCVVEWEINQILQFDSGPEFHLYSSPTVATGRKLSGTAALGPTFPTTLPYRRCYWSWGLWKLKNLQIQILGAGYQNV